MIRISPRDRVFFLTGAGISAESGIPTFRDAGGLWRGYRFEEVASPEAWRAGPRIVWDFYSMRRKKAAPCKPKPAHFALARLQSNIGDNLTLATQNVDNLHELAGSKGVIHMHGELFKSRCDLCARTPFSDVALYEQPIEIPRCECGGKIRPHICWFGEIPFEMERIYSQLQACDIFVCVGSSGVVCPAAGFVKQIRGRARTYYVGPEAPANESLFDTCFAGKAGEVLPALLGFDDGRFAAQ